MSVSDKITVERDGHVLKVGLNRPARMNAFDPEMFHAIARAYGELDSDPELRCGLLWAAGDNFTAGLDLPQWVAGFSRGSWPELAPEERDPFGLDPQRRVSKPVVVAFQGLCYTVGIELALAADIRVAAAGTRFGQIEVKRGIYPIGGATIRFVQEFGWGNAMRYLLTGDEFSAAEAQRIGFVQEVVDDGQQLARALEIAKRVAAQAPLAVAATLRSARHAQLAGQAAEIAALLPNLQELMRSEDVQEGVRSFMERRPAQFKGR